VSGFVSMLAIAPTIVTSRPSRIHVIPSPITTFPCQRLHGSLSNRAGIIVSTTRPLPPSFLPCPRRSSTQRCPSWRRETVAGTMRFPRPSLSCNGLRMADTAVASLTPGLRRGVSPRCAPRPSNAAPALDSPVARDRLRRLAQGRDVPAHRVVQGARAEQQAAAALASGEANRVICSSAGNHAQGVAYAAARLGIPATVVMATTHPRQDRRDEELRRERRPPREIWDEANAEAMRLKEEMGLAFIHPFDDLQLIAGQGTVGLEIVEDAPDVETVIVPIGARF